MESSVPFSFNHWGIWPLDGRSADVFEEDLMKNADVFSLYFCFVSSIIDSRRYPNFIVQRLLFSYATTFWLSQFMRTSEWGDFGAKYRKAITADNSSRYAILMTSNFTYFPKNLLLPRQARVSNGEKIGIDQTPTAEVCRSVNKLFVFSPGQSAQDEIEG